MKSDTKIANPKIKESTPQNDFFFPVFPVEDAFTDIKSNMYAQLMIGISKGVLFLFVFVWVVVS